MPAKARQECGLGLTHDVAGDPDHHVVKASVLEVILDPGAACPGGRTVDHVELAVVGSPDLVLAPVELLVVGVEAVAVEREDVVDDDLRPPGGESGEHLARLLVRPRPEAVDQDSHLDARGELPLEERGHAHPHVALAPAEHEDVHGRARVLDVREDPRKELLPLHARIDRGRGRPGKWERRVVRADTTPRRERLGSGLRPVRGDRSRRGRPTRPLGHAEHLAIHENEDCGQEEQHDGQGGSSLVRSFGGDAARRPTGSLIGILRRVTDTLRLGVRVGAVLAFCGVFVTWTKADPVSLDGMQGPNNGLLVLILAAFALGWTRALVRHAWVGVIGVLGSGLVIGWTALENHADNRDVIGGGVGIGFALVVVAGAVLVATAVAAGVGRIRGRIR